MSIGEDRYWYKYRLVQAMYRYCLDHSKVIYPGKFKCEFIFESQSDIFHHVSSRDFQRKCIRVDQEDMERKRLNYSLAIKKRSPMSRRGPILWLSWYYKACVALARFFRSQAEFIEHPVIKEFETDYVHYRQ